MARPAEKARSMLNKWVAMREAGNDDQPATRSSSKKQQHRRPHLASECEYLADAERFRGQIVREITQLVSKIQNPALPEHELRDLNDEINHKMREKWHWNKRIVELGGVDYNAIERQRQIEQGEQITTGYRYYGAAKKLPGVSEFLEKQKAKMERKVRAVDLYKNITPDYYGWRDEEDGVLLQVEKKAMQDVYGKKKKQRTLVGDESDELWLGSGYLTSLPSQDDIAKALVEHKKKALLAKYSL